MGTLLTSRKSPEIELYDTDLEQLPLNNLKLSTFGYTADTLQTAEEIYLTQNDVTLKLRYDVDKRKIALNAMIDQTVIATDYYESDGFCQHLVDELVKDQLSEADNISFMQSCINNLQKNIVKNFFQNNQIPLDKNLRGFGFIKKGSNIVSTIESIQFRRKELSNILVALKDGIMDIPLSGASIEFYFCGTKLFFPTIDSSQNKLKNGLMEHDVMIPSFMVEKGVKTPEFNLKHYDTVDEMKEDRARFLTVINDDEEWMGDLFAF